ncbi:MULTISPECIES: hypothetical protein [unclassified Paenibacillus]|uniref:hypothetical protein n=1 Tax=unclassified Paenibacillus TaxID=185978 RepID=UPI0009A7B9AE|nr:MULTISPECIES: hypothetical protein [unclassified Paenibacillus]SLJ98165.1 hypothetical protein SAMN06272722_102707 [Paenibacillus sp. RU5A]SOC66808.1 hypothetical protein SAMN05880581_102290 [Paenibacillus sp. RU26A]SOC70043.1 hypothetical protein SAMN05880586_102707 [Paenibacillus sp. RU5M]
MRTTKNYKTNGGDTWNIRGDLNILEGGRLLQNGEPIGAGGQGPKGDKGDKGDTGAAGPAASAGTAAQLQAGTDTVQRTFTAKDIHAEIARQIAAASSGG